MTAPEYLVDGAADAPLTVILAHGAGAAMDTPFMEFFAKGFGEAGYRCARFEFPYMAKRRTEGKRPGPDSQAKLLAAWREAIAGVGAAKTVIGGKSMGGRMASMVADEEGVAGLVCLGYPFHPPGRPERLRTEHLLRMQTPALLLQGTRDPFGGRDKVAGYGLPANITVHWLEDGDHDLRPRKASGRTGPQNWTEALEEAVAFLGILNT